MRRAARSTVLAMAVVGCGATQQSFRGNLAKSADSLARMVELTCHGVAPAADSLGGRVIRVCDGGAVDTIVAGLLGKGDTVLSIRRLWGSPSPAAGVPQLGSSYSGFRRECGESVATSHDGLVVAVFGADSVGTNRQLTVSLESFYRTQRRRCGNGS